jgi:tRNA A-37 threonylcarbamoyl transferase component Bud32
VAAHSHASESQQPSPDQSSRTRGDESPRPDIPGYVIERQIGRGGSATVYLARERKHNRRVAVKVLHAALAASLQSERFLREIEIIARLAHPNILPLLDSGSAGELLYYVTPYVEGESLRERMERERRLRLVDAVRIASEVAEALDYAHRQGVVHRDIKPENILLADGHAVVADFGIARAVSAASDDRLTMGMVPGTPRYMSPEQAGGTADVDGRSDIYSLACVLYELLAGVPPFTGETPQHVAAQHISATVPSLRGVTPRVPRVVEQALGVALSKSPSDRFASASAFAEALAGSGGLPIGGRAPAWIARSLLAIGAVVLAAWVLERMGVATGSLGSVKRVLTRLGIGEATLDTTLYVVFPLDSAARAGTSIDVASLLRAGIKRWHDIAVEDGSRVLESARRGQGVAATGYGARTAAALGAGRYVRVDAGGIGDSVDVSAALFDTRSNLRLKSSGVRIGAEPGSARRGTAALADSLLFRDGAPRGRAEGNPGTTSLRARQAYYRGHLSLVDGNFAQADTEFFRATNLDPEFAQALVWLANVRSWTQSTPRQWAQLASRAAVRRGELAPNDSLLLDALLWFAAGEAGQACAVWRSLTAVAPNDFASWYGLGACLRGDDAVVRGRSARSEWHFRSSYQEAVNASERAFRLQPSILHAFAGRGLADLQRLLFTSGARVRLGRALSPDTLQFKSYPVWQGDSLAFVPIQRDQARLAPPAEAVGEPIQHQRLRFRDIAAMWRAEFPSGVDAVEALAVSMEMLGDPAALDTLQRARAAATTAADRLRMAVNEVWLRVKFSLPSNVTGLRAARALADSILWSHPAAGGEALGSLAALLGRADEAARYARMGVGDETLPAIARNGPALMAFAALGGPGDSLRALERIVEGAVQSMPPSSRAAGRRDWLTHPAFLAFPEYRFELVQTERDTDLQLGDLVAASIREDGARVRQILSAISTSRRWLRPQDIMTDGLLPEASALVRLGEFRGAIDRLNPTLRDVRYTASQDLAFIDRAGSLVRVMVLRADLAHRVSDDETARVWARAVVDLWSGADKFLQPTVQRMQLLAR